MEEEILGCVGLPGMSVQASVFVGCTVREHLYRGGIKPFPTRLGRWKCVLGVCGCQ